MQSSPLLCTLLAATAPSSQSTAPVPAMDRDVVVEAGDYDRQDSVVQLELSPEDAKRRLALRDDRGQRVSLQVDEKGHATFVLGNLKAGARTRYRLVEEKGSGTERPRVTV